MVPPTANDAEHASELAELARLSRSAVGQAALLELARSSPAPDAWVLGDDTSILARDDSIAN